VGEDHQRQQRSDRLIRTSTKSQAPELQAPNLKPQITSPKSQAPNHKQVPNPKMQSIKQDQVFEIWVLEFGICLSFGYWDLRFEVIRG
jgi:hypothetical protein